MPGAIFGRDCGKSRERAVKRHPDDNRPKIAEDCEDCTSGAGCNLRGSGFPEAWRLKDRREGWKEVSAGSGSAWQGRFPAALQPHAAAELR